MLLGNTFDLDRDTTVLKGEVAMAMSEVFGAEEYRIVEYVQEGKFSTGKVLLKILF